MARNKLTGICVWTTLASFMSATLQAGPVDLANVPLVSMSTKVVRPNVMFILDDSTSMTWDYMPDSVDSNDGRRCYRNHGHNKVYYNPNLTYDPPRAADGTQYPNASFNGAWRDGYRTSDGTVDLRTQFRAGNDGSNRAAYYFQYTADPANPPSTCGLPADSTNTARDNRYSQVTMTDATVTNAQRQNFANWYSYYRTRMLMMKTAVGKAFVGVDDKFRVGFTTINETGTNASRFLGNATFNTAHKSAWYSKVYDLTLPGGVQYTPLRGALSKAGRYYAGTLVTGNNDPVQYSCQKNFAILTTDGFWNSVTESSSYGPRNRDNSATVGNQDGDIATSPRPMYDSRGDSNTLADVARYYNRTDLRTGTGLGGMGDDGVRRQVAPNVTDGAGNDLPDGHQHMKTITLSMGLSGVLNFPGDLAGLTSGSVNWPNPDVGYTGSDARTARLDDLWHAAINGGGEHLSASDPEEVVDALRKALATIADADRSGAAAATSSLEPVAGDNYAYVAQYTTARWHGDLTARTIDLGTGALTGTPVWSAQAQLDGNVSLTTDSRDIYTWNGTSRVDFEIANLNASDFDATLLSQYGSWNVTQRGNATAAALVGYLRGRHGMEIRDDATHTQINNRLFRAREHVLGDIIDSSPVYVKKPPFRYSDSGYAAYVGAHNTRAGTVYVGGNDGMLHAFDAETGAERWAYVPRMLHSELYKLADSNYAMNHRFYVNGSITVGDAFDGTNWRTVLVAGLAGGGKGYFALDVTNPENPQVLWEYTNPNLGYTFGNPVLTKRNLDNSWVVLFGSGYNNNTGGGDSRGRLFMVNAFSGSLIGSIPTTTTADPDQSGLAKITNWVLDTVVDNLTQYVYAGDLAGNLWRFDIDGMAAQKMGQTSATAGAQPITSRPEVARIRDTAGNYHRVVYVGTGRYLGGSDVSGASAAETTAQGMYAVKDTGTDIGVFSAAGTLVAQTLNTAATPRTIPSPQAVNWVSDNGWYVALPTSERVTIDPRLQLGTITFVANIPVDDYCSTGGRSWLYALDYRSGGAITSQAGTAVGYEVTDTAIATGVTIIRLPDGRLIAIVNTPAGTRVQEIPTTSAGAGTVRRVGYREIN